MPTSSISTYLIFAHLQMAAEAHLDLFGDQATTTALEFGNNRSTRFTKVDAAQLAQEWKVAAHQANTSTGFSGTVFECQVDDPARGLVRGQLVMSLRSTEFADDAARDNEATNASEIKPFGWAFGQIDDMMTWFVQLNQAGGVLAGKNFAVTGYSLGGHLATAFTQLLAEQGRASRITSTYTFNGAGVGSTTSGNLTTTIADFHGMRSADHSDYFSTVNGRQFYLQYRDAFNGSATVAQRGEAIRQVADARTRAQSALDLATVRDLNILHEAMGRSNTVLIEAERVNAGIPGGNESGSARPVAAANIDAIDLDYQLAVLRSGTKTAPFASSIIDGLGAAYAVNRAPLTLLGASPIFDIYGAPLPSAVANSQQHYGTPTPIYVEDQPLMRGTVPMAVAWQSLRFGEAKLLAPNFSQNDFGDTHSLVLIVDSLSVQNMLASLDSSVSADTLNTALRSASNAKASTTVGGQGAAEGDTLENLLDAVRRMVNGASVQGTPAKLEGGTWANIGDRDVFHNNLKTLTGSQAFKDIAGKVKVTGTAGIGSLPSQASTDFGTLLSLINLSPVVLQALPGSAGTVEAALGVAWSAEYAQWSADRLLTSAQRATGLANFTSTYLNDRQALLQAMATRNVTNASSTALLMPGLAESVNYIDRQSGSHIELNRSTAPLGGAYVSTVVFGSGVGETIVGNQVDDRLYGGSGNDTLIGLSGADYIEGNTGNDALNGGDDNDTLVGGADSDTYTFDPNWGHDTVEDSDGKGSIIVSGLGQLSGADTRKVADNTWQTSDKKVNYTLCAVSSSQNDLYITFSDRSDVITLRGWSQTNNLGITGLTGSVATPPTSGSYAGDFSKALSSSIYAIAGGNYVSAGPQANASDVITGSSTADRLQGLGGNDALAGMAGDDWIEGGDGDDVLLGGLGRDTLEGGAGRDFIYAAGIGGLQYPTRPGLPPIEALGPEYTRGFSWVSYLSSTSIYYSSDPAAIQFKDYALRGVNPFSIDNDAGNVFDGGAGDDQLFGGAGADVGHGGADNDAVQGLGGSDILFGDDGNDLIVGDGVQQTGFVNTVPWAQHGNDLLNGGSGDDALFGNGGNDALTGGDGNDTLEGGRQDDELLGGAGADVLLGDANASDISGEFLGNDYLDGGDGNDTLEGGGKDDQLYGGAGDDSLQGDANLAGLAPLDNGADLLDGQDGNDVLFGGGKADTLLGGAGDDELQGDGPLIGLADGGDDILDGGPGNDELYGDGGNDWLAGGDGNDQLSGDAGSDTLIGGAGIDVMAGGAGDDTYIVRTSELEPMWSGYSDSIDDIEGRNTVTIDAYSASDVTRLSKNSSNNTVIEFRNGTALTVTHASVGRVASFEFLDGQVSAAQLIGRLGIDYGVYTGTSADGAELRYGDTGDNGLYGGSDGAELSGGRGNDRLNGWGVSNRYLFDSGDGVDDIYDASAASGAYSVKGGSRIVFGADIAASDLSLSLSGTNLVIQVGSSGTDAIRLSAPDPLNSAAPPSIERLEFADGSSMDLAARYRQGFSVLGTAQNDSLQGSSGPDQLDGGAGDDTLNGAAGSDGYAWGLGIGSDRIVDEGPVGDTDALRLSATLTPSTLLLLNLGNDLVLHSRSSLEQMTVANQFTGQGIEKLVFADGTQWSRSDITAHLSPDLTDRPEAFTGTAGNDTIRGFGGNDTLDGSGGDDRLDGGAGDDVLYGQAGNDTLIDGWVMVGGDGSDSYQLSRWASNNEVLWINDPVLPALDTDVFFVPAGETPGTLAFYRDLSNGDLQMINGDGGQVKVMGYFNDDPNRSGLEELRFADGQVLRRADVIARLEPAFRLIPTAGDDRLTGLRFDDVIDGGAGNDTIAGVQGNDSLSGSSGEDQLAGGEGNDTLRGGPGTDWLIGGSGSDTYRFGRGSAREVIDQGNAVGTSGDRILLDADVNPSDLRLVREGSHLALQIVGTNAKLSIDRYFTTNAAGQALNAIDGIVFATGAVWSAADINTRVETPAVSVSTTSQGIDTVTVGASHRLGANQENLTASGSMGVRLMGNDLSNVITGGSGDDVINGPDMTDSRSGWDGSIRWDDRLDPTQATGTEFTAALRGGADTLIGGLGNDLYYTTSNSGEASYVPNESDITASNDQVVELTGQGEDTVVTTAYHETLPSNVENLISFSHQSFFKVGPNSRLPIIHQYVGNALDNRIDASHASGTSRIDGGAGADELVGSVSAENVYVVDNAGDRIVEFGGVSSFDAAVESSISYLLPDAIKRLVLTGSSSVSGTGNRLANLLDGVSNSAGNVLTGGLGDDTYRIGAGDTVVERAGEGMDTVIIAYASGTPAAPNPTLTLGSYANVEAIALDKLAGSAGLTGTANNDTLRGNSLDNQLDGGAGDDVISDVGEWEPVWRNQWLSGVDRLLGGPGNDTLTSEGGDYVDGGSGNDYISLYPSAGNIVVFGMGQGHDTVTMPTDSYKPTLTLQFLAGVSSSGLLISRTAADVVVGIANATDSIRFVDALVAPAEDNAARYLISAKFADGTTFDVSDYITALRGTEAADSIVGTASADRIYGLGGNDSIDGGDGDDALDGNDGNDTLVGGLGSDTLRGGAGDDTYRVDNENDKIIEGVAQGLDTVESSAEYFSLTNWEIVDPREVENLRVQDGIAGGGYGNDLANRMQGNSLNNSFSGSGGNDTLQGYAGDDVLNGGSGNDLLEGGSGNDTFILENSINQDTIIDTGGDHDVVAVNYVPPAQITLSRNANNLVIGQNGTSNSATVVNHFNGAVAGIQAIEEIRFDDGTVWNQATIASKVGNRPPVLSAPLPDKTTAEDSPFSLALSASTFTDPDVGNALTHAATLDTGAALPTWLSFSAATRTFSGTPSNADVGVLQIKVSGTDQAGASASDVFALTVTNTNDAPTVAVPIPAQAATQGRAFSLTVPMTTFADVDVGDARSHTLTQADGSALPVWLAFNATTRVLSGSPGNNHVGSTNLRLTATDAAGASASTNFNLVVANVNDAPVLSAALADQIGKIGNAFAYVVPSGAFTDIDAGDTLSYAAKMADGSALPGWLSFSSATRAFSGIPTTVGTSSVRVTATDAAGLAASDLFDLVVTTANLTLTGTASADTLVGGAYDDTMSGLAGNDDLRGGAGNDYLDGGIGNDKLQGGTGNDTYVVDSSSDSIIENAGEGTDTVRASISWTLGSNLEQLVLTGSAAIDGIGNTLANSMTGNAANNALDGGIGADTLAGGGGNDSYVVDNVADVINESAGEGTDSVTSSVTLTLAANVENLTLSGSGSINGTGNLSDNWLIGNSVNNVLTGAAGNDTLDGGTGNDTLMGGAGNDLYVVNVTSDVVTELANEGIDSVNAAVTWTLGNNLENLTLTGSSGINGTGNTLDNLLLGNAAANTLTGNAGADTLNGAAGNDTLIGGAGADSYLFDRGWGIDTVQENDATSGVRDRVMLQGTLTQASLKFNKAGNNLEMAITGTADKMVFQNWYLGSQYHVEEFRFGNGSVLTDTQAQALVGAMAAFGAKSSSDSGSLSTTRMTIGVVDLAASALV